MVILQTANGSNANSANIDALLRRRGCCKAPITTFQNNEYIHRLNRTLQAEMRALSGCRSLLSRQPSAAALHQAITDHDFAARELARLVIANRGVPEDKATLSFGLTQTLIRVCSAIPVRLFEKASYSTLIVLEKNLSRRYNRLLVVAPLRDQELLGNLKSLAEQHQANLIAAGDAHTP